MKFRDKKGVNFAKEWTEEHTAAWLDIKKALMTYPTLRCFDPKKECFVYTDSSQFHCGGCLIQFHDELDDSGKPTGQKNPCAVASVYGFWFKKIIIIQSDPTAKHLLGLARHRGTAVHVMS